MEVLKQITNLTTTDYGFSIKKNIAFDNLNRVWFYNYDTLYVIENEEVIKKFVFGIYLMAILSFQRL
jgi:hypothetical protein